MSRIHAFNVSLLVLALSACNGERPAAEPGQPAPAADAPVADVPPAATPANPPVEAPDPAAGLARFDGYGDMRFGMSESEARAAWAGALSGDAAGGAGNACHYLNPAWDKAPSYFAFMFDGGKFVRYDVGNDTEVAPGGGKRGMDADRIRALYPDRVRESPHKYVDGGKYLRIEDTASDGVLVFETDAAGKVTEWHAGLSPQVDYIEGCS